VRRIKLCYYDTLGLFDGYHGLTTKDEAHRRRMGNNVGASALVSPEIQYM